MIDLSLQNQATVLQMTKSPRSSSCQQDIKGGSGEQKQTERKTHLKKSQLLAVNKCNVEIIDELRNICRYLQSLNKSVNCFKKTRTLLCFIIIRLRLQWMKTNSKIFGFRCHTLRSKNPELNRFVTNLEILREFTLFETQYALQAKHYHHTNSWKSFHSDAGGEQKQNKGLILSEYSFKLMETIRVCAMFGHSAARRISSQSAQATEVINRYVSITRQILYLEAA